MRFGSLFSGIGGFDLGFVWAGISCAWMVERDKAAQAVLRERFPGVPIFDDVTTVGVANLDPVDLVCGGFPCQDVSQAGRRAGLAGSRSGLWWEFRRILDELHPTWCVIENVPGLLSSNGTEDMGAVLWSLGELGYGYAWRVLDAQWLGVAQRRERVFIVGNARDWAGPAEVLLEPEGVPRNPPARGEAGEGVARPLGCPSASGGGFRDDLDHGALVARVARNGRGAPQDVAFPLTAEAGRTGKGDSAQVVAFSCKDHGADAGDADKGDQDPVVAVECSDSLTVGANQTTGTRTEVVGCWAGVRRLMPVECERLQGFPDGWTDVPGASDSARYRQLGNAVAVPVAEWIGRRIVRLAKGVTP